MHFPKLFLLGHSLASFDSVQEWRSPLPYLIVALLYFISDSWHNLLRGDTALLLSLITSPSVKNQNLPFLLPNPGLWHGDEQLQIWHLLSHTWSTFSQALSLCFTIRLSESRFLIKVCHQNATVTIQGQEGRATAFHNDIKASFEVRPKTWYSVAM